jgi:signal peptidase II
MMSSLTRRAALVITTALACVGCDQTTKLAARSLLPANEVISLLGDTVRLQLANNYGAFLSLGEGLSQQSRAWLLSVGVGCVLLAVLWYALTARGRHLSWVLALALMLGGGASNLLDRLRYGGYVVDFINLGVGPVRTGIFNVADVAIMVGVVLLLYSERRGRSNSQRPADESS